MSKPDSNTEVDALLAKEPAQPPSKTDEPPSKTDDDPFLTVSESDEPTRQVFQQRIYSILAATLSLAATGCFLFPWHSVHLIAPGVAVYIATFALCIKYRKTRAGIALLGANGLAIVPVFAGIASFPIIDRVALCVRMACIG